jgi:hypothetical protein
VKFSDGTVSLKLLFTEASVAQVPYLAGSREWEANIFENAEAKVATETKRTIKKLRLLQVDVAVRDERADSDGGGWVFGTFTYNKDYASQSIAVPPWSHLQPIGLMWGNDEDVTYAASRAGKALKQTVISASPVLPYQHLGWGGRLSGPVDNRFSSCISCHATAQFPIQDLVPLNEQFDSAGWRKWFRNIKSGDVFNPPGESLDYSLQLGTGIGNFKESHPAPAAPQSGRALGAFRSGTPRARVPNRSPFESQ